MKRKRLCNSHPVIVHPAIINLCPPWLERRSIWTVDTVSTFCPPMTCVLNYTSSRLGSKWDISPTRHRHTMTLRKSVCKSRLCSHMFFITLIIDHIDNLTFFIAHTIYSSFFDFVNIFSYLSMINSLFLFSTIVAMAICIYARRPFLTVIKNWSLLLNEPPAKEKKTV